MEYISLSKKDREDMLSALRISEESELFAQIPERIRSASFLNLPEGLTEEGLIKRMTELSSRNGGTHTHISFLGGGAYDHFIPSVVKHIIQRSEFYTSYTPYQPEISQGNLQAMFEFQTVVSELTGLDLANASMYDGSTAASEAAFMAMRVNRKKKILISETVHPEYRSVLRTHLQGEGIFEIPYSNLGVTDIEALEREIMRGDVSAVIVQSPNFFGSIEDVEEIAGLVKRQEAILILIVVEPFSLGLLKPPGMLGVDIAAGEFQPFAVPLSFGGPYVGFFATKSHYIRQSPGRIVGETTDANGKRSFVLTFATREQHIRRERATSNICTNQSLLALAAIVFLSLVGKEGIKELALQNLSKAQYLKSRLNEFLEIPFGAPTFNEFVLKCKDGESTLKRLLERGFFGGIPLEKFYPELKDHVLICVTERRTREELDSFINALKETLAL